MEKQVEKAKKYLERLLDYYSDFDDVKKQRLKENRLLQNIAYISGINEFRTEAELTRLICEIDSCDYNAYEYHTAKDFSLLLERNCDDQIRLMEELKKHNYEDAVYKLIIDSNLLEKRTTNDQIKLIQVLRECEYDDESRRVATNPDLIETVTIAEQSRMMLDAHKNNHKNKVLIYK